MANLTPPLLSDGSLIVRPATLGDVAALQLFVANNRAALAPVEPRRPENYYTHDYCQMRIVMNQSQFDDGRAACFLVFEPDNTTVIGTINFSSLVGYPYHGATLGYSLAADQWGKGRMQRALQLSLDWIFEAHNLHRICANHLPDNLRSARLLAKLGFQREGYAPDYLLIDGRWRDHVLNALTATNWRARDHTTALVANGTGYADSAPDQDNIAA